MKRLHLHVGVESIDASVRFYSALFAAEPDVLEDGYAKWMLEDPRVNFAISTRGSRIGPDHLGIQVETKDELNEVYDRLRHAGRPVLEEGETVCCYAESEKSWVSDPQGVPWEVFLTHGGSTVYGGDAGLGTIQIANSPMRAPTPKQRACRGPTLADTPKPAASCCQAA